MKCHCLHGAPWFMDCPECCTGRHAGMQGTMLWTDQLLGQATLITPELFAAALTAPERQELLARIRAQMKKAMYTSGITQ